MRLIDADALGNKMYHEAFENDASYNERNPMAKWDSGLWIRYKMFENTIADAPSIDIVFSKECRWGKPYSEKQLEWDALGLGGLKFPDDFCSHGEYGEREGE